MQNIAQQEVFVSLKQVLAHYGLCGVTDTAVCPVQLLLKHSYWYSVL
jgi:hypothetical protein